MHTYDFEVRYTAVQQYEVYTGICWPIRAGTAFGGGKPFVRLRI